MHPWVPAGVRELLADAQLAVPHPGSCTACVALLNASGTLTVANLGDSGARVIRRGVVAMATTCQKHQFNMPYQMASPDFLPDTDTAADALIYQVSGSAAGECRETANAVQETGTQSLVRVQT